MISEINKDEVYREFTEYVNMTPTEIDEWLETEKSKMVGELNRNAESIGSRSAKRNCLIKNTKKGELTPSDFEHMQKVNGFINRRLDKKPSGNFEHSDWRYSLKNWGHDPMKLQ